MNIPDYQTCLLPVLQACSEQQEHSIKEIHDQVASHFNLSNEELSEMLPSGNQSVFNNRIGWARTYLKKAGLLISPSRGIFKITDRGIKVLNEKPTKIDAKFLMQFPEFAKFQKPKPDNGTPPPPPIDQTPQEIIENEYQNLKKELASEVLEKLKEIDPYRFEKIVVELLVKMGYGGTIKDAGKVLKKSGDDGIDGIIKEDRLGLDAIYVQAKRWGHTNVVTQPEIQKFAGALDMKHASKGIFITTSSFSSGASACVEKFKSKIVLIDGEELAEYMIDFNLGVSVESTFEIKKVDTDYFTEE
ncbi:MAG: restriction endonuclease [Candidatus Hinthialibacter antarcticus]|nr:restriction endonuclease [Candidatus Hinthialibacter antarcticus]